MSFTKQHWPQAVGIMASPVRAKVPVTITVLLFSILTETTLRPACEAPRLIELSGPAASILYLRHIPEMKAIFPRLIAVRPHFKQKMLLSRR